MAKPWWRALLCQCRLVEGKSFDRVRCPDRLLFCMPSEPASDQEETNRRRWPQRQRPAQKPLLEAGNRSPLVYVTACTKDRKPLLAKRDVHELLVEVWSDETNHWSVGRYILLPDHLHLFCSPKSAASLAVTKWCAFWKSKASNQWPRPEEQPVWQVRSWDTQLRCREGYDQKWAYVRENPVLHGLVVHPEDWPYQGEIEVLGWHDA